MLGPGNMEDQVNRSLPEVWKYSKNDGDMLVCIYIYICNYLHNSNTSLQNYINYKKERTSFTAKKPGRHNLY